MSENTEVGTQASGRQISVLAFGGTADEIELAALDKARQVFGVGPALTVVRNYKIHEIGRSSPWGPEVTGGKAWYARVEVHELASGQS